MQPEIRSYLYFIDEDFHALNLSAHLLLLMATSPKITPNGTNNAMPLTEYSAKPDLDERKRTRASDSIRSENLLPDGHPDV